MAGPDHSSILLTLKRRGRPLRALLLELEKDSLSMSISMDAGRGIAGGEDIRQDRLGRLAELCAPHVRSTSELSIPRLVESINATFSDELSNDEKSLLELALRAHGTTSVPINHNARRLTGEDLFSQVADSGYLRSDPAQLATMSKLLRVPFADRLLYFSFQSYCVEIARAVAALAELVGRRPEESWRPIANRQGPCIFCKSSDGGFKSEEHIYPESIGNNELILERGLVCDRCNQGILSDLDKEFLENDIVAFLRVLFTGVKTKDGRYPSARSQRLSIERVGPSELRLRGHGLSKQDRKLLTPDENGFFQIPMLGRKPFSTRTFSRSLFKIALELVCHHEGPEVALNPKFDNARAHVFGIRAFKNWLLIREKGQPIHHIEGGYLNASPGVICWMNIFGLFVAFNLEEEPKFRNPPEPPLTDFKLLAMTDEDNPDW